MSKFVVTGLIEIEVEADNEKQAFQKALSKLDLEFLSCKIKSLEKIEEE